MIELYGVRWDVDDPIRVELRLYSMLPGERPPGALSTAEHLTRAIKLLLPEGGALVWHRWMDEAIRHWCERDIITCWGPSSAGKSAIFGLLAYVDLLADPDGTLTIFITETLAGHQGRSWGLVKEWRAAMPKEWQVGKIADSVQAKRLVTTGAGSMAGIHCYSSAPGDSEADLKKKLGGHNRRNRLVVDEAQACGAAVLELRRNLGATGEYKEVLFGNPDAWTNPLGIHSEPADEDHRKTESQSVTEWETANLWNGRNGICFVLDGRNSPGCDSQKESKRVWFLPNEAFLANYRDQPGGEDAPKFWTYAIGRIPPAGGKPMVLSEADARAVGASNPRPWASDAQRERWVGVDTSLGGDDTVLVLVELGEVAMGLERYSNGNTGKGRRVIAQVAGVKYATVNMKEADASGQLATQIIATVKAWGVPWRQVVIESGGQQGHIVDTVERMAGVPRQVGRLNPAGPASERTINAQGVKARERIATRAAELALNLSELIGRGSVANVPEVILKQLQTRGLSGEEGKTDIQDKRQWKRENGNKSPDEMDALAVVCDVLLAKGKVKLGEPVLVATSVPGMPFPWMEPQRQRKPSAASLVKMW